MNRIVALILLAALPALAGCTSMKLGKKTASSALDAAALARPDLAGKLDAVKKAVFIDDDAAQKAQTDAELFALAKALGYSVVQTFRYKGNECAPGDITWTWTIARTETAALSLPASDAKETTDLSKSKELLGKLVEESGAAK